MNVKQEENEHDFKLLRMNRVSERRMSEVMRAILCTGSTITATQIGDKQAMRLKPDWTWCEILVCIPRRQNYPRDHVYTSNIDWFRQIRGLDVLEPPAQPQVQNGIR